MKIKTTVSFLSNNTIEAAAKSLLERYGREFEPITELPVPVEKIADLMLELTPDWGPIADDEEHPILAFIDPEAQRIRINERHQERFATHPGMLEFTLAHEVGHYQLHVLHGGIEQLELDFGDVEENRQTSDAAVLARLGISPRGFLCRDRGTSNGKQMREKQADQFASYLLLPEHLVRSAIDNVNLLSWSNLYRLRDRFKVSITALTIRLKNMGLLFVGADGTLYKSEAEAIGMKRLV